MSEHDNGGSGRGDSEAENFAQGPNTLCFTCGGFRRVSEPRVYVIQATTDMQAGMTMAEWRTCPHCRGTGHLRGLDAPV
ncbi:hypothetical protein [Haloactinomyces albus]|uniref:DnaJ-class molecular chaperone n=1 Tax=Haloactinomyces albus TaxID=1352928 RepID=A0AAE4CNZ9_9ACTN|nr:hypothetical protein [Haloactinomyces albus]MDR7301198.1 DnaJ-class molecular chaperone [Haloactinomyces albus]